MSLPCRLYLLKKNIQFKPDMSKDIDENIDVFTKLLQDVKSTRNKNIDDYYVVVLLNVIPHSYNDLKAIIEYGHDSITLDIVVNAFKSKERELKHCNVGKSNEMVCMLGVELIIKIKSMIITRIVNQVVR